MAYGGRGRRGPPYGQGRGGGGRGSSFVWPPPASTPRPVSPTYQAAPMGYRVPMVAYQAAYGHAPPALYLPAAPPAPQVVFQPPPAPVPVTIRAPSPAPVTIRAPPPAPSPAPAPPATTRQPASAPAPTSSAPSPAALAKEVEKKLFVPETALAPPAAAAAAAVAASQGTAEEASDVELAPVSKKGMAHPARPGVGTMGKKVMIRANHFLVDVADNNLFHYDVVASMDWPEITKYRGLVSAQPHRQEIIEDLFTVSKDPQKGHTVNGGMMRELLIAFRRKTNRRPERIIFYRDGVSEGQFSHVLLHEMDAIRKDGYLPPVTFVVVQKRHHTRLFPEFHGRRDMTDRSGNILPGTVVDQKICHPTEFDFYLCSHAGIQGTSRPTHYHVLYDENHFTADALQSLTSNLCYT
ncbi:hypothetical protein PR202_gb10608 [Eleusine coracana subsp. coracana]|uniref:Piwi domain-containing protein n=1 Tax=Eleusine coracana subsp. coracana TaxID=191504 RepID=A0AAV5EI18_ELECO|nr:hypothetical protein PR202_gb10608 [Eleusine coracana subsp. coracana]